MDTNVQALKNLYVALGGEASDVENLTTSSEVITAMESVAASAASELPVVKPADEGKTLTVNSSGKWAAVMPESVIDDETASETKTYSSSKITSLIPEQNAIVVPITISGSSFSIKNDAPLKTLQAIGNALSEGKYVVLIEEIAFGQYGKVFHPCKFGGVSSEVFFNCIQFSNDLQSITMYCTLSLTINAVNIAIATA